MSFSRNLGAILFSPHCAPNLGVRGVSLAPYLHATPLLLRISILIMTASLGYPKSEHPELQGLDSAAEHCACMHARVPAAEAAAVCLPGATIAITRAGKAWQSRPATASLCGLAPREARAPRLLRIGVPGPRGGRVRVRGRKACAVLTRCEDRVEDERERVRAGGANGDPGWPRGADKASDSSTRRARGGACLR